LIDLPDTPPEEMLPAERRQHLIDWFKTNMSGSSQDLARMFNISVSTIRRDLDLLASEGLIRRTHGGAVRIRPNASYEPSTDLARRTAVEEKHAIAREAMRMIEPDQSILIDTGAVVAHMLADEIAATNLPLAVFTNDLYVAKVLTYKENIRLIVPGGACRFGSFSLLGEPGMSFLRDIRCDQFFMSAQAVDAECVSETMLELVQLKRAMIAAAQRTILMIDSSRFSDRALYRTASIEELNTIITDEGLSEEEGERLRMRGVELITASF